MPVYTHGLIRVLALCTSEGVVYNGLMGAQSNCCYAIYISTHILYQVCHSSFKIVDLYSVKVLKD